MGDMIMFMRSWEPSKKKMAQEVNMAKAREDFFSRENTILYELVKNRYRWMNEYINDTDKNIYEIGCGIGFSKEFIDNPNVTLTDVLDNPWVDRYLDALNLDMDDDSVDVFLCSNVLHHFASPYKFLKAASKKLKPGGRIIFFEPYSSVILKMAHRTLNLEGWNDSSDVFSEETICNIKDEPWSANLSIPKLLFGNKAKFETTFFEYKLAKYELTECFLFLLSGGVNFKTFHPKVSQKGCQRIEKIDNFLVKLCPKVFALGLRAVIVKK
jgi:SAM-dependent methyltransferase